MIIKSHQLYRFTFSINQIFRHETPKVCVELVKNNKTISILFNGFRFFYSILNPQSIEQRYVFICEVKFNF